VAEVDRMIEDAAAMIPVLQSTRYIRAYAGVRPLVGSRDADDRSVSRGYSLIDHAEDGVDNFITITGGKLTTYRLMAEKTADLICDKLGVSTPCRTHTEPLPPSGSGRWAEPGRSARSWIDKAHGDDVILCECEMVSAGVVDDILDNLDGMRGHYTLKALGQRSRVGKGPCQGGFCGPRVTAHLYDTHALAGERGLAELKAFIERRWRGKKPILWATPLMQAELQEALHCCLLELDLFEPGEEPTGGGT
jgi:glycerol-3-phosphate dehydrogenase